MQKQSISWSLKQLKRMYEKGTISFDHPIQRKSGQWKPLQKSELIHSLADDYPLPPVYAVKEGDTYFILDGKQRLTTLFAYINGEFEISEGTDTVNVEDENYEIEGKDFPSLSDEVQDQLLSYMILVYKMDIESDEEIENLFLKLNQGTPLSKQQKAKAVLGVEWANRLQAIFEHSFVYEKAHFTNNQLNSAGNETAIIQAMMILDPHHEFKTSSTTAVYSYTQTFKEDVENKIELVNRINQCLDYLDQAFIEKDKQLLKKVHFPMIIVTADYALNNDVSTENFIEWIQEFKQALKGKSDFETNYNDFTGQGSTKQHMVLGRVDAMKKHIDKFIGKGKSVFSE